MASLYGDYVAKTVKQGAMRASAGTWVPIVSNADGVTPLAGRRHVRIQLKSNPGGALALAYSAKNADGSFSTPTDRVGTTTIMPGNMTWVEPVSDAVQIYGQLSKKAGFTNNHIKLVITEYA